MNTAEVARRLGVSPTTVRTWVSLLELEIHRDVRGHRIFSPEDLARLEGMKDGGRKPPDPLTRLERAIEDLGEIMARSTELLREVSAQQEALSGTFDAARKRVVSGLLKQLLAQILCERGQLTLVSQTESQFEYRTPRGERQVVENVCLEGEQGLLDAIIALLRRPAS